MTKEENYKEIVTLFTRAYAKNKNLGDYITLATVIKGKKFKKVDVRKAFLKLVNRDEYDWSERNDYIDYLFTL